MGIEPTDLVVIIEVTFNLRNAKTNMVSQSRKKIVYRLNHLATLSLQIVVGFEPTIGRFQ